MNLGDASAFIMFANKKASRQLWLDLGCGTGLFTVALAGNLPPGSKIIAIDKDEKALKRIPSTINDVIIETMAADFVSDTLDAKNIDGILMANSLHYVKDKATLFEECRPPGQVERAERRWRRRVAVRGTLAVR